MAEMPVLYKLMTLYALSRVELSLTNRQISGMFLDLGYTNYFNVQYTLSDLLESRLITADVRPEYTTYALTGEGLESLEALKNDLSPEIRRDIDEYLRSHKLQFMETLATKADVYRTTTGEYAVHCQVLEHRVPLIDLTVTVPTEEAAQTASTRWKEQSQTIYAGIMNQLLG